LSAGEGEDSLGARKAARSAARSSQGPQGRAAGHGIIIVGRWVPAMLSDFGVAGSIVLDEPAAHESTSPAQRLRTTMAAVRVSVQWLGVRKTLTPEQRNQAADTFGATGDLLSAGKKLLDTYHPSFKAVTAVTNKAVGFRKSLTASFSDRTGRPSRQSGIPAGTPLAAQTAVGDCGFEDPLQL